MERFVWKDDSVQTDADVGTGRATNVGGNHWVQYDFPNPAEISSTGVYWAVDGRGRLKLPESARVLVKQGNEWKTVSAEMPKPKADAMNIIRFAPVTTQSVRLEATSPGRSDAGILEWWVR